MFGVKPESLGWWHQTVFLTLITASQAFLNHRGIRIASKITDVSGYLIFATTFSHSAKLKAVSVNVLGFRAPLGAFIAAWGGIAMLTSAPFDNWWHDAYGIDVKIVSPPHILLILGVYAVVIGTLVLLAGHMNRSQSSSHTAERRLILYIGHTLELAESTQRNRQIIMEEYVARKEFQRPN